jgi:hypothetical protein
MALGHLHLYLLSVAVDASNLARLVRGIGGLNCDHVRSETA